MELDHHRTQDVKHDNDKHADRKRLSPPDAGVAILVGIRYMKYASDNLICWMDLHQILFAIIGTVHELVEVLEANAFNTVTMEQSVHLCSRQVCFSNWARSYSIVCKSK